MASVHETTEWRKLRPVILQRDLWTCQMCGALLRTGRHHKAAAVIDHKKPYDLRPDLVYDPANLWALCRDCHDRECRRIEDKARSMRQWTYRGADWIASEKAKCRFVALDGATIFPTT